EWGEECDAASRRRVFGGFGCWVSGVGAKGEARLARHATRLTRRGRQSHTGGPTPDNQHPYTSYGRLILTHMRHRLILALIAMPQLASAQLPAGFNDVWSRLARQYHERMSAEGMVGSSLWLMHDGEIVAREHHGFADLETR